MRASGYARVASDFYREPAWLIAALLAVEPFDGPVWDPCCGTGNIPKTVIAHGGEAHGSDIIDRGYGDVGTDFFQVTATPYRSILSNPPFAVIEPFIRHALSLVPDKVVVLARLALLEGQKRRPMLTSTPLARVLVSSRRVSMPPGDTDIEAKGGTVAFAFFVWEHGHQGPPTVGWV